MHFPTKSQKRIRQMSANKRNGLEIIFLFVFFIMTRCFVIFDGYSESGNADCSGSFRTVELLALTRELSGAPLLGRLSAYPQTLG
jgi:hypothetical protein